MDEPSTNMVPLGQKVRQTDDLRLTRLDDWSDLDPSICIVAGEHMGMFEVKGRI